MDGQHVIAVTQLTDVAKIPREVASELFEASQVAKVKQTKIPGFEFKDKVQISSGEMLSYLKAILIENQFFTFGPEKERLSRLISKVHKYLKTYLSSYPQKCSSDIKDYVEAKDASVASSAELFGKSCYNL